MYNWSIVENPADSDLAVLVDGVIAYGRSLSVEGRASALACLVRDDLGIIGGASGRTEYDRLFVSYLWVAEALRSNGLGTKILEALEDAARQRGCVDALVETLNPRAATLYGRLGYRVVAQVPHFVGPFTKHIMVKAI